MRLSSTFAAGALLRVASAAVVSWDGPRATQAAQSKFVDDGYTPRPTAAPVSPLMIPELLRRQNQVPISICGWVGGNTASPWSVAFDVTDTQCLYNTDLGVVGYPYPYPGRTSITLGFFVGCIPNTVRTSFGDCDDSCVASTLFCGTASPFCHTVFFGTGYRSYSCGTVSRTDVTVQTTTSGVVPSAFPIFTGGSGLSTGTGAAVRPATTAAPTTSSSSSSTSSTSSTRRSTSSTSSSGGTSAPTGNSGTGSPAGSSSGSSASPTSSSSGSSSNVGAIVGGVIGGVAAIGIIAFVAVFLCLKRRNKKPTPQQMLQQQASQPLAPSAYNQTQGPPSYGNTPVGGAATPAKYAYGDQQYPQQPVAGGYQQPQPTIYHEAPGDLAPSAGYLHPYNPSPVSHPMTAGTSTSGWSPSPNTPAMPHSEQVPTGYHSVNSQGHPIYEAPSH